MKTLPKHCHFFFLTQIVSLNVCDFHSFDLDDDQRISETELSILIDITGIVDLDEFFKKLDINKGKVDTLLYTKINLNIKHVYQYICLSFFFSCRWSRHYRGIQQFPANQGSVQLIAWHGFSIIYIHVIPYSFICNMFSFFNMFHMIRLLYITIFV